MPTPVTDLAARLAISERQLRRRVAAAVGYGPKRLARVFRLRRALDAAHAGDELARVAFDAGYADQAHFANECRALAGASPSALLATRPFPARQRLSFARRSTP
jgi:AraC-like DNA-binding protein